MNSLDWTHFFLQKRLQTHFMLRPWIIIHHRSKVNRIAQIWVWRMKLNLIFSSPSFSPLRDMKGKVISEMIEWFIARQGEREWESEMGKKVINSRINRSCQNEFTTILNFFLFSFFESKLTDHAIDEFRIVLCYLARPSHLVQRMLASFFRMCVAGTNDEDLVVSCLSSFALSSTCSLFLCLWEESP